MKLAARHLDLHRIIPTAWLNDILAIDPATTASPGHLHRDGVRHQTLYTGIHGHVCGSTMVVVRRESDDQLFAVLCDAGDEPSVLWMHFGEALLDVMRKSGNAYDYKQDSRFERFERVIGKAVSHDDETPRTRGEAHEDRVTVQKYDKLARYCDHEERQRLAAIAKYEKTKPIAKAA